jgi:hypothetical protein|tara:strand:+ start:4380 stop:4643 length:264 start_codon:yes stop_codon:yes gene_type:complete
MVNKNNTVGSCDGFQYTKDAESKLNGTAVRVFETDSGAEFLRYLENITINNINGSAIDESSLKHIEGQRWIVGIIKRRLFLGKQEKS